MCACVTCVRTSPETQEIGRLRRENEQQNCHKQRHAGISDKPAEDNTDRETENPSQNHQGNFHLFDIWQI